eukprot:TRINITY_DN4184_c0_g1_i1.p2 TRINITY_DN4184_c0_g1~~TRINITY_DN4184_c0_g1_i1.p2  ORF type:complete len:101 (-),score=17.61 TRINITY_DN4184_c0_g1_i1:176-478(-)
MQFFAKLATLAIFGLAAAQPMFGGEEEEPKSGGNTKVKVHTHDQTNSNVCGGQLSPAKCSAGSLICSLDLLGSQANACCNTKNNGNALNVELLKCIALPI